MRESQQVSRRDFQKQAAAILGGLALGSMIGCSTNPSEGTASAKDLHTCRGLNDCKGLGGDGKNSCRGQGTCATIAAHTCGGQNECKGQGGCGANPALNDCKGQGGCAIPLMDGAWATVRERMEKQWKEKSLEFGEEPPAKKS
ncbi:hypothetical protein Psta_0355 [Pirellula staleyi DSM 6068]|uniref:Uncharacterized protein n=1 Tax=Pirellula staleyi (strain ATCC 27377 / DSM 6068 / ICPB 4128) TaxID=530564 RepID=D2R2D6_PIRSD|nr:hypothetical protein [Pirellula staleyi]ADB15045.1 hypothetical protein Psta_0355 [Pirellula staleyi DSM 6068]